MMSSQDVESIVECSSKAIWGQASEFVLGNELFSAGRICSALNVNKLQIINLCCLACWQLLVLDNLLTCAQVQVTKVPVLHGQHTSTGMLML